MPALKYFTQPEILQPIGCCRLFKLLSPFSEALIAAKFPMPPSDGPAPSECFAAIAAAFALSGSLPPALLDLLLTLESAASPENKPRLDQVIERRIPNVSLNGSGQLDRALEIHFAAPDELPQFAPSPATTVAKPSTFTPQPSTAAIPQSLARPSKAQTAQIRTPHSDAPPSHTPDAPPSHAPDDFMRLARLAPIEYEQVRRAEAKRLGLRLRTLDEAVERAGLLLADAEANEFNLSKIEPWPEPITDAPALFEAVHARVQRYLYLPVGADVVLTIWPAHANVTSASTRTPRLNFTSTEPGCGKTTCIELLSTLCPNFLITNSLKPAVLYRILHKGRATVALDELDLYLHLYPELQSLLNAGNNPGACAHRCEGRGVRAFKVFGPIILSGLGHMPRTLRDRSIIIQFTPAPAGALEARFDLDHADTERILGRKIARWARDNFERIAACDPVMPPAAYNRLGDNWRPLFAIAQIIGGPLPQRLLEAFTALTAPNPGGNGSPLLGQRGSGEGELASGQGELPANSSQASPQPSTFNPQPPSGHPQPSTFNPQPPSDHPQPSTFNPQLLADLRLIFTQSNSTRLFSSTIVDALCALPNRPWSAVTTPNGPAKPITEAWLSKQLRPLGIRSRTLRINGVKAKGYELADFFAAFAKHLDPNGPKPQ